MILDDLLSFDLFDQYLVAQKMPIIHQVWFGTFESKYKSYKRWKQMKPYRESWIVKNPTFCHIVWNRKRSMELIQNIFPEYIELFNRYSYEVQRCDMIRYCILYRYGGIYADMDYKCKKSFLDVIQNMKHDICLVQTPNGLVEEYVSNSLMIAKVRGHMFWKLLLLEMNKFSESYSMVNKHIQVMYTTGPKILSKMYHIYRFRYKIGILPFDLFHPLSLKKLILEQDEENKVYAIHIGNGSWESGDSKLLNNLYINLKFLIFFIVILFIPQIFL